MPNNTMLAANRSNASRIWDGVTKISPTHVRCNYCQKQLKYGNGTSNIITHLKKHNFGMETARQPEQAQKAQPSSQQSQPNFTSHAQSSSVEKGAAPSSSSTSSSSSCAPSSSSTSSASCQKARSTWARQTQLGVDEPYRDGSARKKELDDALLEMVFKDMLPFTIVDGEGFRNFATRMNPRYRIPVRQTLKAKLEPKYQLVKQQLIDELKTAKQVCVDSKWAAAKY